MQCSTNNTALTVGAHCFEAHVVELKGAAAQSEHRSGNLTQSPLTLVRVRPTVAVCAMLAQLQLTTTTYSSWRSLLLQSSETGNTTYSTSTNNERKQPPHQPQPDQREHTHTSDVQNAAELERGQLALLQREHNDVRALAQCGKLLEDCVTQLFNGVHAGDTYISLVSCLPR